MVRKKTKKADSSPTTMTFIVDGEDEVKVVPVDDDEEDVDDPGTKQKKKPDPVMCTMCGKVCKDKHALKNHMYVHKEKTEKCDKCDMAFNSPFGLTRHKLCKHMDPSLRPHPCHLCERRFLNKSHLAAHIKTHTGERDVTCGLCFQSFYSKADLVRHMKGRHLNIRSFTCHICNKGFFRKSYLKEHLDRVHMSQVEEGNNGVARCFACRHCKKVFFSRTTCYGHERSHTKDPEQRSLCMHCGKTFSRPSSLKKHLEKHTGPPKIKCDQCDRLFYHLSSFRRHQNIHNRTDPDICQVCGKVYTNKDAFRRHLKRHVARGEMDALPPAQKELANVSKMQALISKGADLDEVLLKCNVEVVELGGKNNSKFTIARDQRLNDIIEKLKADEPRWVLNVDEVNHSISFSRLNKDLEVSSESCDKAEANTPLPVFNIESLGYMNNRVYTVISNDFKSIVKDSRISNVFENNERLDLSRITQAAIIFHLKTALCNEDTNDRESLLTTTDIIIPKDVNVELFSSVTEIDIPNYVEEIPEIKNEFMDIDSMDNYCETSTDVEEIDMSQSVYELNLTLDAILKETFHPVEIVSRGLNQVERENLDRAFDDFEANIHAPHPHVRSTEKEKDFSEFWDLKRDLIEWTDQEIQVKISNILNGNRKTKVYGINNMVNIHEDSEKLDNIVAEMPIARSSWSNETKAVKDEDLLNQEELGSDVDDFIYEDMIDVTEYQSNEEEDVKPDLPDLTTMQPRVMLDQIKTEPELSETTAVSYDDNKENIKKKTKRKTRSKRKRKMSVTDSDEEYVEKKIKKKKKKKKKQFLKVKKEEDVKYCPINYDPNIKLIEREFICHHCGRTCQNKGIMRTHILTMHLLMHVCSCHECGRSFINKSRLEAHILNVHLKVRNYQCASCAWAFFSRADLVRHERKHTGLRPFMCDLCSKTFNRKAQLKNHMVVHTGERNFVCNECGKKYATRSTLSTHLKRHEQGLEVRYYRQKWEPHQFHRPRPGDPILCNQCGKELSTVHSLKRHIHLVHMKPKKTRAQHGREFHCLVPACEHTFSHKTSMQRHMHRQHKSWKEPRTHSCPVCNRRLLNEACVLRHMILKHPENCDNIDAMQAVVRKSLQRHIPCPICKRMFLKEKGMRKHMAQKHFFKTEEIEETLGGGYEPPLPPCPPPPIQHMYEMHEEKPNLLLL